MQTSLHIEPACDALGRDNKLKMTTDPLTGTIASTGGRYSVVYNTFDGKLHLTTNGALSS